MHLGCNLPGIVPHVLHPHWRRPTHYERVPVRCSRVQAGICFRFRGCCCWRSSGCLWQFGGISGARHGPPAHRRTPVSRSPHQGLGGVRVHPRLVRVSSRKPDAVGNARRSVSSLTGGIFGPPARCSRGRRSTCASRSQLAACPSSEAATPRHVGPHDSETSGWLDARDEWYVMKVGAGCPGIPHWLPLDVVFADNRGLRRRRSG